ncbi:MULTISPECIES: hypothetical protein [Deinococcus]|uniref:P pilus assembly protein, chaperone PapD n=1 Tax=Deinococcus rufus TaxID=2136097 RepID=A0ABV7Z992_9DEIO|nr:hypothetical protein [Deinococcus sp. AB2017081]WQE97382.1 hypothetical protein U2P90_19255 [Deinococcus sp. AB2017081]
MKRLNRMLHTVTALGALAGTTALAATGVSLDVSRVELAVQPGQSLNHSVTVRNPGKAGEAVMAIGTYTSDFVLPVTGEAQYVSGGSLKSSVGRWLQVSPGTFRLGAGESQQVRYTISVPAGTAPGLYWSVLFFKSDAPDAAKPAPSSNSVTMNYNVDVGQIIYVQVGQPRFDAKLTAVQAAYRGGTLNVSATVKNTGTALVRAAGRAVVVNAGGQPVATIDLGESVALPGYTRAFTGAGTPTLPAGQYQVLFALKYGQGKLFTGQAPLVVGP